MCVSEPTFPCNGMCEYPLGMGVLTLPLWDNEQVTSTANEVARRSPQNDPRTHDQFRLRSPDRMDNVTPVPTSVYRYYDRNNVLLYVGITNRGTTRNSEHNTTKTWWQYVTRQEVEHYPHRLAASEREKHLIRRYRPPFNTQHNPDWQVIRALYETTAGQPINVVPTDARRLLALVHHKLPLVLKERDRHRLVFTNQPIHAALAANLKRPGRVLLRAPKKIATLVDVVTDPTGTEFTFYSSDRVPAVREVRLHLKARSSKPLVVEMHEATGEVGA